MNPHSWNQNLNKKYLQIYDIYDKHRLDDEGDETEYVKADESDRFILTNEQDSSPSKSTIPSKTPSRRIQKNHPEELIIGDINSGVGTRSKRQESITLHE